MDRDDALRRAERMLRQGRLDAAIEEYASVVLAYPKDWTTGNLLGDLFIRAGRVDRAVEQYARIAEQLAADGFLSKAAALYKKIIKITDDDEVALLRTAELASQQGLPADARHVLNALFQRRLKAGDREGAVKIATRLASLDPNDVVARLDAARMFAEIGDTTGAADHLRLAGDTLAEQGRETDALRAWREAMRLNPENTLAQERVTSGLVRQGDLDGALSSARSVVERRAIAYAMIKADRADAGVLVLEQALEAEPGHVETRLYLAKVLMSRHQYERARDLMQTGLETGDARLDLALAEADLRTGGQAAALTILRQLLEKDPDAVDHVAALGASLTEEAPDVAFVAVDCALEHLVRRGELDSALKIVERFVAAAPRHVPALERFAELCREGRFDDRLYHAESDLAEAYLVDHQFAAALRIAERLAGLRPDVDRHEAQMREARAGLDDLAPETLQEPGDPHETLESLDIAGFASSLGLPEHREVETDTREQDAQDAVPATAPDEPSEWLPTEDAIEIELTDALEALAQPVAIGAEADLPEPPAASSAGDVASDDELGSLFSRMRDESGRNQAEADAMRVYDEAGVHYNEGRFDDAVECLRRAGRDPSLRFRASVMLARIATDRGQPDEAIRWFEQASESPAPSAQAEASVLYELGVALERAGEPERAQAVFLTLHAMDAGYRDVAARLAGLVERRVDGLPES